MYLLLLHIESSLKNQKNGTIPVMSITISYHFLYLPQYYIFRWIMTSKDKTVKKGNLLASIGGLFTILSLTVVENNNWKIILSAIGVVLALYGFMILQKSKKNNN